MAPPTVAPLRAPRWLSWCAPLLVVALGLLSYSSGSAGVFVFDDHLDITDNVAIREPWPPWRVILDQGQSGVSGRPVVALTYALNYEWCEYQTWGWHWVNVAVHLLTALAVLGCVRRALELPRFAERWGARAQGIALAVAAVWVVHPLATGVIMYRGQRVESMMAMFFAATLYCALRAFTAPYSRAWPRLAVLACALGTGCKEVIVGAPVLVLLFDALFVAGSFKSAWTARRGLHAGLFGTWALIALFVVLAEGRSDSVGFGYSEVGVWQYLTTQAWAVPHYLQLSLWPDPLVFDYGKRPITDVARWLPGGLAVLALLAVTAWGLVRRNPLAFLGAFWFVILAPSSSVLPIVTELIVEHRAYLPSAAVLTLAALGAATGLERLGSGLRAPAAWLLTVAVIATFTWLTRARVETYSTEIGIWADTVAKLPGNDRAQACYGNDLRVAGRVQEAGERYHEAVRLAPSDPYWAANYGTWLLDQGRLEESIAELERSRDLLPTYGMTLQNLGAAYQRRGDLERAIATWQAALDEKPPGAAYVAAQLALLLQGKNREEEALDALRRGCRLATMDPDLHLQLARGLLRPRDAKLRDAAGALAAAQRVGSLRGGIAPEATELEAEALAALGRRTEAGMAYARAAGLWRALGDASRARECESRAASVGTALPMR